MPHIGGMAPTGPFAGGALPLWEGTNSMIDPLIAYLSGLTVSQGRLAGEPLRVLPWEARFVRGGSGPGSIHPHPCRTSRGG